MLFNFLHDKWTKKWQTKTNISQSTLHRFFCFVFSPGSPFIWMKGIVFVITYFSHFNIFFCHQIYYFFKHFTYRRQAAAERDENEWASLSVWCLSAKAAQKFISMDVREGKSPIMQKARWAWHYQARAQHFAKEKTSQTRLHIRWNANANASFYSELPVRFRWIKHRAFGYRAGRWWRSLSGGDVTLMNGNSR